MTIVESGGDDDDGEEHQGLAWIASSGGSPGSGAVPGAKGMRPGVPGTKHQAPGTLLVDPG